MKAIIWTRYGPPGVLQPGEVEKPIPKDGEILVKVHAATVTMGDCEARGMKFPGLIGFMMRAYIGVIKPTRTKILGMELAGEVEAVGATVTAFKPGDAVYGVTGLRFGAYAEYALVGNGTLIARKPANITYEEAAVVPVGGQNALHFLRKADVQPGQRVLINGAGGSIGTFAVQLARHYGAEATAVDSAGKLDMLREIGAAQVIDYTQEDFMRSGETYDVIFDVVGKLPLARALGMVKEGGFFLVGNPRMRHMIATMRMSSDGDRHIVVQTAEHVSEDLDTLRELIEAGEIRPVLDRSYPLEEAADAHRYVESGQKIGNVALTVIPDN